MLNGGVFGGFGSGVFFKSIVIKKLNR